MAEPATAEPWEELVPIPVDPTDTGPGADTLTPGGKSTCRDCGKELTVTAAGKLRSHRCVNDLPKTRNRGPNKGAKRGKRRAPANVRTFGVQLLGGAIEWTAATVVSRAVPCNPADVPTDLGIVNDAGKFEDKADEMVGPILDLIWPQLPPGAQKALEAIADETDLIVMAFLWYEWGNALKNWTGQQRARVAAEQAQAATPTVLPFTMPVPEGGVTDGFTFENVEPFTPADPNAG